MDDEKGTRLSGQRSTGPDVSSNADCRMDSSKGQKTANPTCEEFRVVALVRVDSATMSVLLPMPGGLALQLEERLRTEDFAALEQVRRYANTELERLVVAARLCVENPLTGLEEALEQALVPFAGVGHHGLE